MLKSSSYKTNSLYSLIDEATDNQLKSENEELNTRICSEILRTSDGPKVAAKIINKIISKSLTNHCYQSIWYCLLLLDLAVKNTHSRFCAAVLSKEFFGDLIKILDPKYQVPDFVQEKLQYILKEWYTSQTAVPGYQNLTKFFKNPSPSVVPQVNAAPNSQFSFTVRRQSSLISSIPEKDKILRDIDVMETTLSIFSDTLRSINLQEMTPDECQFLKELHDSARGMQTRIEELLPWLQWEDVTSQLLQANDNINNAVERYERMMASRANQDGPSSLPTYKEASVALAEGASRQTSNEVNLIDFDEVSQTQSFYKRQPLPPIPPNCGLDNLLTVDPVPPSNQNRISSDEFDCFIESIARRHQTDVPEEDVPEDRCATPLYDKAFSKRPSHS